MSPLRFVAVATVATLIAALSGCADGGGVLGALQGGASAACAAPEVTVDPSPVVAGEPATLTVTNLIESCNDQGQGLNLPAHSVTVSVAAQDGSWGPVDLAALVPGADFTATATIQLRSDTEPGAALVSLDGVETGGFEVVAP